MTEPIRVLHVLGALDSGGVSNFVMNAYRQLDRTQVQFDFAMTSGKTGLFDEQVQAMGGRIFYFDPARSLLDNLQYVLRKNGPFAAVHSHVFFYSGLVLRAAKRAGVPVRIAHAHNAHTGESRLSATDIRAGDAAFDPAVCDTAARLLRESLPLRVWRCGDA